LVVVFDPALVLVFDPEVVVVFDPEEVVVFEALVEFVVASSSLIG
jgi:hypothetical protein